MSRNFSYKKIRSFENDKKDETMLLLFVFLKTRYFASAYKFIEFFILEKSNNSELSRDFFNKEVSKNHIQRE